jgi:hypothetical protein
MSETTPHPVSSRRGVRRVRCPKRSGTSLTLTKGVVGELLRWKSGSCSPPRVA